MMEHIKQDTDANLLQHLAYLDKLMEKEAKECGVYMNPDYHYMGVEYQAVEDVLLKRGMIKETIDNYVGLLKI